MKYKLIAIDMDGTLLNSKDEISKRTKMVLSEAIRKGILVVLTTGRIYKSALQYSKSMQLYSPIIACNGAIITSRDVKRIIYDNTLKNEHFRKIVSLAEESDIYYHFYDKDTFYYKKTKAEYAAYYNFYEKNFLKQDIKLESFKQVMDILKNKRDTKFYKILFMENDLSKLSAFRQKLEKIQGISICKSWYNNLEVMNEGVSKGRALEYLARKLDIDNSQIVAMGDNENDISMLKIAGLAIAMGNSDEIVKKHADVITDTNDEDGVANALERHILNY